MKIDEDLPIELSKPAFMEETERILSQLKNLDYNELKKVWKCSDKIAELNYDRIKNMDLHNNLSPAILSYEGIQYQYMGASVFSTKEFDYIQKHLRILSGLYGMLKPFDGVTPYRLEMQAKLKIGEQKSLYEFWNGKIAEALFDESDVILNLASKEYSKCILDYVKEGTQVISCVFGELKDGRVIEKGTKVKMARGEMVRFMAENQVKNIQHIKKFDRLNYRFSEKLSDKDTFVFCEEI